MDVYEHEPIMHANMHDQVCGLQQGISLVSILTSWKLGVETSLGREQYTGLDEQLF